MGGFLVIPIGLIHLIQNGNYKETSTPINTQLSAAKARAIIMQTERDLGFEPVDRELEKLGYDIESRDPKTGKLRFIEVKGRISGAATITVNKK